MRYYRGSYFFSVQRIEILFIDIPYRFHLHIWFRLSIHILDSSFDSHTTSRRFFRKNITVLPFLQHLSISTGAWYSADSHRQQHRLTTWPHQFSLPTTSAYTFGPGRSKQFSIQHGKCSFIQILCGTLSIIWGVFKKHNISKTRSVVSWGWGILLSWDHSN
jgi:hypothetical protein